MVKRKFTVILLPDGHSYQVIFPHYPNCITCGDTVEEALANAREAIELHLKAEAERGSDPLPHNVYVEHLVVGNVEADVPGSMAEPEEELAESPR